MQMIYSTYNLNNFNQQNTRLKHTIAVDETRFKLYRQLKKRQATEGVNGREIEFSYNIEQVSQFRYLLDLLSLKCILGGLSLKWFLIWVKRCPTKVQKNAYSAEVYAIT